MLPPDRPNHVHTIRLITGHYFEDRTSHRFMETLHRAGVKPVWVDKAGRIKQMHALLRRRVEGGFGGGGGP